MISIIATLLAAGPPDPSPTAPPGLDALATQIIGWLKWGVIVAGMIGMMICSSMIIMGRRQRSATAYEGMIGSAWILGGLALASAAGMLVGAFSL